MDIIENIKSIAKIIQKADNIQLYQKILDVQSQALHLMEENIKVRQENNDFKDKFNTKQKLLYQKQMYWFIEDDEYGDQKNKDGPFCTRCWDDESKTIRLHSGIRHGTFQCPKCQVFVDPERRV